MRTTSKLNRSSLSLFVAASLFLMLGVSTALAATEPAESAIPVPTNFIWIKAALLAIMWLFIAAIILGPVVMFFHPDPAPEAAPHHADSHADHADPHADEVHH